MYRHGIVALYLNGRWIKYDATLDIHLVKSNNLYPVEFSVEHDCLMPGKTPSGKKHIEYSRDYGFYSDVSYELIYSWFLEFYPHLIEHHENLNLKN